MKTPLKFFSFLFFGIVAQSSTFSFVRERIWYSMKVLLGEVQTTVRFPPWHNSLCRSKNKWSQFFIFLCLFITRGDVRGSSVMCLVITTPLNIDWVNKSLLCKLLMRRHCVFGFANQSICAAILSSPYLLHECISTLSSSISKRLIQRINVSRVQINSI